jgi:serralysin
MNVIIYNFADMSSAGLVTVRLILVLSALLPSLAFSQGSPVTYKSQTGQTMTLVPWPGRNVSVLTQNSDRDPHTMKKLVAALDKAYVIYERFTGAKPGPNPQGTLNGRDIVAEVPDAETSCSGAACSYLGTFGSEIGTTYFNQLYEGIRLHGEYDQAMFYEFGRTFWFYQDQLGQIDTFVTGFAIANRFISLDRAGLKGGPFGELSYSEMKNSILVEFLKSYLADASLNWRNTLLVNKAPPSSHEWSAADLAGAMIYRVYSDFGFAAYKRFWKSLGQQAAAQTPDDAIRNFLAAAKVATGRDYGFLLKDRYVKTLPAKNHD